MIDHIYRLFKPKDYEEAREYLANNLMDNTPIKIISMNPNNPLSQSNSKYIITNLMMEIIQNMYGVNVPQMANFLVVQEVVYKRLKDHLLGYISAVGMNANIVEWTPTELSMPVLANRFRDPNFDTSKAADRWSPNVYWDFNKNMKSSESITSPLNGFIHLNLYIRNVTNYDFLLMLYRSNVIKSKYLKEFEKNRVIEELEIQLLPYNNFNKVLNIANAIFRYY